MIPEHEPIIAEMREQIQFIMESNIGDINDKVTRDKVKTTASLLLAAQDNIQDFVVVCDETNNSPSRVDEGQLYCDVAVQFPDHPEFYLLPFKIEGKLFGDITYV